MQGQCGTMTPEEVVSRLEGTYRDFARALAAVRRRGDEIIPVLITALERGRANAAATALGLLMQAPRAEQAIPPLLDWLEGQNPVYPDALEALVQGGDRVLRYLLPRLRAAAEQGDDEAVRNYLDLGVRLPDDALPQLVPVLIELLRHPATPIQEAAADALWRIGLPHGRPAIPDLLPLRDGPIRHAAQEALARLGVDAP